jgi:endonuclease YncB( thermonuclease family)
MPKKIQKIFLIIFVAGCLLLLLFFIYQRIEKYYQSSLSSSNPQNILAPVEEAENNNVAESVPDIVMNGSSGQPEEIKPAEILPDNEKVVVANNDFLGVKEVIDGDTIVLTNGEKVRYIGIDTPELNKPGSADDECLAWAARLKNMELLNSGSLELVSDSGADKDTYGRLLRYVYVNGVFVNVELARLGLAREFFCQLDWKNCPVMNDQDRKELIVNSVKEAEKSKRGLYSQECKK